MIWMLLFLGLLLVFAYSSLVRHHQENDTENEYESGYADIRYQPNPAFSEQTTTIEGKFEVKE